MSKTSTLVPAVSAPRLHENKSAKTPAKSAEPSELTIRNILSFSKNLDVKPSRFVSHIVATKN
jgi:hypothetical protein